MDWLAGRNVSGHLSRRVLMTTMWQLVLVRMKEGKPLKRGWEENAGI